MQVQDVMTFNATPTALVVDDDASIRRLCRAMLEKEGWCVHEAADGAVAVASAKAHLPDVIIMDVLMPKLDGLEATRLLRADPATENIPIIIFSALSDSSDAIAGLEAGADEYLVKPLNPREFVVRVRSMTRLHRAWRELHRNYDVLGEHARSLNLLLDFSGALAWTEDFEAILDKTMEVTATLTSCRRISIMLPDSSGKNLRIARSVGLDASLVSDIVVPVGDAIAGEVFATRRQIVCNAKEDAGQLPDAPDLAFFVDGEGRPLPRVSIAMCAAEETVAVLNATDRIGGQTFSAQELDYLNLICNVAASAIKNILTSEARDAARDSIVVALAKLAEHRDDDTGKHLERVTIFCLTLAKRLRRGPKYRDTIDTAFLRNLQRAAPLHDIGKVAIPDSILLKAGRLSPEEMAVMRTHAAIGTETIRSVLARTPESDFLKMAEEIAHGHHEWYDGSGYPRGTRGNEIPLAARILALADVYDALTTRRVYKEAIPHDEAVGVILDLTGTQFDPDIVDVFRQCQEEFRRLAGELADSVDDADQGDGSSSRRGYRCQVLVKRA